MRSIAFLSQKGGSGKTTLAAHIAIAGGEGRETVILPPASPTLTVIDMVPHAAAGRPTAFVLNACDSRIPEVAESKTILARPGFPVVPVDIGHRVVIPRTLASGQ